MAEQMSLDNILADKKVEIPVFTEKKAETEAAPAAEQTVIPAEPVKIETEAEAQARGRDAQGKFVAKEPIKEPVKEPAKVEAEKPAVPAAPPQMSDKERAYLAAAIDERNKRQALERQLEAAKATAAPAEPTKQFWDDPEGVLAKLRQEVNDTVVNTRLQTSEMIGRAKHTDFDEKIQVFAEIVQKTPGLWQQALAAPDPGEFAYTTGKHHKELQDAGSIENLRAQIEKQTRIKMEEEFKKKQEDAIKERASIPPSLSDVHGTTQNRPVWSGPTPLDSVLKP